MRRGLVLNIIVEDAPDDFGLCGVTDEVAVFGGMLVTVWAGASVCSAACLEGCNLAVDAAGGEKFNLILSPIKNHHKK